MSVKIKQKSWLWWLTFFANPNMTTTINPYIFVSKNFYNHSKIYQDSTIKHEMVHIKQQQENGLLKFLFLYCFCLLILWNPWRYKWEYEAYKKEGYSDKRIKDVLGKWCYGWLITSS